MKQLFAKDIVTSFALQIFDNGRNLLLIPVIAKTLGASGYGIWIQVKIGAAFLAPFLLLGLLSGVSRFLPGSSVKEIRDGLSSTFVYAFTMGVGIAFLIIISEAFIERYLGLMPSSRLFIRGLALLAIAEPLNNLSLEYFRSFRRIRALLTLSIFDTLFEFFPVLWFAYHGFGISVIILAFACGRLFMSGVKILVIWRKIGLGNFEISILGRFIKFGFPLLWLNIFFYLTNYLDRYLLGYFHSAKEVGVYSFAYAIGYTAVLISAPWDKVLAPTITAYWNKAEFSEVDSYFSHSLYYCLIIVIPLTVFISAMGKEIIKAFATTEFLSAIYIIPVMLITFFIFEMGAFYQRIAILKHNSLSITKAFGLVTIISIALNFSLIPKFSSCGAAASLLTTYGILSIIFYRLARKDNSISPFNWFLLLRCLLATIPGLIIIFLGKDRLFFTVIAAVTLYFTILCKLDIVGKKEISFLKKFLYVQSGE